MADAEETVWVIFNGEIYNFRELRGETREPRPPVSHELRHRGDSSSATRKWGTGVFGRLNGMFGVAIWGHPESGGCTRPRCMGIKLVYYAIRGGSLCSARRCVHYWRRWRSGGD